MRTLEINLRQEVTRHDALAIKEWMEDHEVTKYLNELSNIAQEIQQAINRVNMYIMTHLFNRDGSFFVVCTEQDEPIGFIKLIRKCNEAEIVVVIGDKEKWGQGFGTEAIYQGLNQAFFDWRIPKVIAKIDPRNTRSMKAFKKTGFQFVKELSHTHLFHITLEDYIKHINA
jgi:RimJ/RimL family protein N-acetyltransferase